MRRNYDSKTHYTPPRTTKHNKDINKNKAKKPNALKNDKCVNKNKETKKELIFSGGGGKHKISQGRKEALYSFYRFYRICALQRNKIHKKSKF
ncbi:Hypothetical protein BN2458_PEG1479 [Helicobacter typhlonius]|uniref:Uncharacterized protein n=1 Tax=Helicobacter typhlonius TaxID=76936 RepID=A0A0S4PWT5_9HELI|nr:Hypothetical protein BN2458_PEG1479 [Helicobacter typhlonius]HCD73557.1 hypothetical protein [Helicobacter sp.]